MEQNPELVLMATTEVAQRRWDTEEAGYLQAPIPCSLLSGVARRPRHAHLCLTKVVKHPKPPFVPILMLFGSADYQDWGHPKPERLTSNLERQNIINTGSSVVQVECKTEAPSS